MEPCCRPAGPAKSTHPEVSGSGAIVMILGVSIPIGLDQLPRSRIQAADPPSIGLYQPIRQLSVEIGGRGKAASGQERGLEIPVHPLDDALGFRVIGRQLYDPGGRHPGERHHTRDEPAMASDAGFVVPQQSSRHRTQLLIEQRRWHHRKLGQQLPHMRLERIERRRPRHS